MAKVFATPGPFPILWQASQVSTQDLWGASEWWMDNQKLPGHRMLEHRWPPVRAAALGRSFLVTVRSCFACCWSLLHTVRFGLVFSTCGWNSVEIRFVFFWNWFDFFTFGSPIRNWVWSFLLTVPPILIWVWAFLLTVSPPWVKKDEP